MYIDNIQNHNDIYDENDEKISSSSNAIPCATPIWIDFSCLLFDLFEPLVFY